ncbi:MAG TPA: DUF456 domain-containing protein [Gemmatimonadaceae bacterium]|nr:DUF456 domain-containing protein [Gemmatimonadaceae bacterium]
MEELLLMLALLVGLVLIPFGLPGLWVMVGAALLYSWAAPDRLGVITLLGLTALAVVAEVLEFMTAGRYARKYGGSSRAGWGAIAGGIAGAIIGVPVPIIGSVIGAFAGSFAGALAAELTLGGRVGAATRVATGALIGRAVATALKVAIGVALLAWVVLVLLLDR